MQEHEVYTIANMVSIISPFAVMDFPLCTLRQLFLHEIPHVHNKPTSSITHAGEAVKDDETYLSFAAKGLNKKMNLLLVVKHLKINK